MDFQHPLIEARLIRRYQRFFADVDMNGDIVTAHCPNPGALLGVNKPGAAVWLSRSDNPKRKLAYTLEMIEATDAAGQKALVGVNTGHPNRLVEDAIKAGVISELQDYASLRREVRYGKNSRIDIFLENGKDSAAACYVEVKNVHMSRTPGLAEFPDCVTTRGAKHLRELSDMVEQGHRAVMVFCVQRSDCKAFALAADIDAGYAEAFEDATRAGVETLVYTCHMSINSIAIGGKIFFQTEKSAILLQ